MKGRSRSTERAPRSLVPSELRLLEGRVRERGVNAVAREMKVSPVTLWRARRGVVLALPTFNIVREYLGVAPDEDATDLGARDPVSAWDGLGLPWGQEIWDGNRRTPRRWVPWMEDWRD